jgi:hypothetical protein
VVLQLPSCPRERPCRAQEKNAAVAPSLLLCVRWGRRDGAGEGAFAVGIELAISLITE